MTTGTGTGDWSVPESEVLASVRELLESDREGVLATVVDVEGSAYRRPGAKMVIDAEGGGIGHITAGCLEDEVLALAREVLQQGRPRIETYDLMEGDDDVWGLGVGCNGVIDILLEPIDESYRPALEAFEAGEDVGVVTVLAAPGAPALERGTRLYYRPDGGFADADGAPDWLLDALAEPTAALVEQGGADTVTIDVDGGDVTAFVDTVEAPPELLLVGSGHDAGPVVELAKRNDFRVTVVGFRGAADLEERFPAADETLSTSPATLRETCDVDGSTYAVVMTHNFVDDRLAVDELLRTPCPYVGLMGPRERFEEMLEAFADEGRTFDDDELDRVYTPVGLDLGAGSPYGIATSIVAEVLAVHNGRQPRHLKAREGPIHDRFEVETDAGTGPGGPEGPEGPEVPPSGT